MSDVWRRDVTTSEGTARVRVPTPAADGTPRGTLLLGHGAGGQRDAADVLALTTLAQEGWTVVLVDQPWRVAGRRVATPPPTLDRAWHQVTTTLADVAWQEEHGIPLPLPWVVGGRSAGARVACRTSTSGPVPVSAVVCLAFPLHPPGRPERTRAEELLAPLGAGLPTLVVQGSHDPFGSGEELAAAVRGRDQTLTLITVDGSHSPARDLAAVRTHVSSFLSALP